MKTKIVVVQKDIRKARKERSIYPNSRCCPIYQALKRKYPNDSISVGTKGASVGCKRWKLSKSAMKFIGDNDPYYWKKAKPFSFYINL